MSMHYIKGGNMLMGSGRGGVGEACGQSIIYLVNKTIALQKGTPNLSLGPARIEIWEKKKGEVHYLHCHASREDRKEC